MDVNFEIRPGERVGLVGPNGTGKTTLMKIIAGKEDADGGKIEIHPSVRMGYLEQTPDYSAGRTLIEEARHAFDEILSMHKQAEEVAAAMAVEQDPKELERLALRYDHLQTVLHTHDAYNIDYKVERVLEGLGFARSQFNTMVEQLSGGEQNRLMLAKLLLAEPDLMLLDEPSNHLDIEATEWLEDFIANGTAAVLVVSHDRYFLDKTITRTLELFRGTVDSYTGNFSAYWTQKAERLAVETKTYEKQQEEIEKAKEFIRRNHYGMKAGQAEDRRKKLERIVPVPPPRKIEVPPMGFSQPSRSGDVPLKVVNLKKSYDRPLFKNVTFTIQRGERWGILGPNGAGKTTLLRCILGKESPDAGQSQIGGAVRIGYFDQQLHEVPDDAEVIDSIIPPKEEIVRTGESKGGFTPTIKDFDEPKRRSMLARFGITGDMVFQKVSSLSGGERCRAAMARLCALEANFLILDEPTNHLDLWAREGLEESLQNFDGGTVLFVSHDRYFINQTADHLLVIEPDGARIIEGNYDDYLRMKKGAVSAPNKGSSKSSGSSSVDGTKRPTGANDGSRAAARTGNGASPSSNAPKTTPAAVEKKVEPPKKKRKFPYRKVADIEADIEKTEQEIAVLQEKSLDPATLRDGAAVKQVLNEIAQAQQRLEYLMEHWEEASELNW